MPLPSSGQISMSQVNTELGFSATAQISLNDTAVRTLFDKPSGQISMSDGWGKSLSDPNFENVTLLLHGDGTNGGQNNTFIDGSTNNFTITRNGNTTQGSFSPYGDLWSNYFDGTGDSLQTVSSSLWTWSTSTSWTVEAFVYPVTRASVQPIYGAFAGVVGSATNNGELLIETTGQVTFRYWNGAQQKVTTSGTVPLNTWSHVVMAYDGTNIAIYINGTRSANAAKAGTPDSSTNILYFGTTLFGSTADTQIYFTGYISNARVVRNTVVYSGATISVPTTPLTAVSGTSLLTCQSNRFRDNSSNNFTITRNGDVRVHRFSPFAPSAAYSAATLGGSAYFDGAGDYLTTPSNTALVMGTGQFWFEAWIYMPSAPSTQYIVLGSNDTTFNSALTVRIQPSALRVDRLGFVAYDSSAVTWQYNAWQHIAVGRDSVNTLRFFVNGQAVGTRASTIDNFAGNSSAIGLIPVDNAPTTAFKGYIASARLLKGECLYTATFTPPSAPITAITNTSLLLNFTNAAIFDNAMMADLETVGNAQISTSVKKYGTGSLAFDGTGDSAKAVSSPNLAFGSGNFTIEGWVYFNSVASGAHVFADYTNPTSTNFGVAFYISATGTLSYYLSSNGTSFNIANGVLVGSISAGQWYHIALVRNGNVFTPYLNGVAGTTTTSTASLFGASREYNIGGDGSSGAGSSLNGYIDDLRITKGVARYTANFTPPTQSFPNR